MKDLMKDLIKFDPFEKFLLFVLFYNVSLLTILGTIALVRAIISLI